MGRGRDGQGMRRVRDDQVMRRVRDDQAAESNSGLRGLRPQGRPTPTHDASTEGDARTEAPYLRRRERHRRHQFWELGGAGKADRIDHARR